MSIFKRFLIASICIWQERLLNVAPFFLIRTGALLYAVRTRIIYFRPFPESMGIGRIFTP
jgi:hypothetical protein